TKSKRKKDWNKIKTIIDQYELPRVPKSTFDAAKAMAAQKQQRPSGQDGIPGTVDDIVDLSKVKLCAECSRSYPKDQLSSYVYNENKVKVCSECLVILEKDGHREPKLLASITDHDDE
ncbi:MAG: hypothetical protein ACTSQB_00980, partial [Candidatus Heimdallarchaeota archaeon]